jgi:hypothetical protein
VKANRRTALAALLGLAAAALLPGASPREQPGGGPDEKEKQERLVREALEKNKPTEHHKKLNALAGSWQTQWKVWSAPGKPAGDPTKGTATFKWTMDGRFLRGTLDGEMLGQKFESEILIGYNPFRKRYESTWVNSFETALSSYTGQWAQEGDKPATLTLTGKADDHFTGRTDVTYRAVFTFEGKDRVVEEVFGPDAAGKEFKAAEVIYTRAKGDK